MILGRNTFVNPSDSVAIIAGSVSHALEFPSFLSSPTAVWVKMCALCVLHPICLLRRSVFLCLSFACSLLFFVWQPMPMRFRTLRTVWLAWPVRCQRRAH
jgi:hypothetical protein